MNWDEIKKFVARDIDVEAYKLRPFKDYTNALDMQALDYSIEQALKVDITHIILADMMFSWRAMLDDTVSIIGETGTGKSSMGMRYFSIKSLITSAPFDLNRIKYNMFEFLNLLRSPELKKGDIIMLDEAGDANAGGAQSGAMFAYEANLEKRMRALQITKIFCSPDLQTHLHHYILRCWSLDRKTGMQTALVETEKPEGYWNLNSYQLRGHINLPFMDAEVYKEYMTPKEESIEESRQNFNRVAWEKAKIAAELIENAEYKTLNKAQQINFIERNYPMFATRSTWVEEIRDLAKPKKNNEGDYAPDFARMGRKTPPAPRGGGEASDE